METAKFNQTLSKTDMQSIDVLSHFLQEYPKGTSKLHIGRKSSINFNITKSVLKKLDIQELPSLGRFIQILRLEDTYNSSIIRISIYYLNQYLVLASEEMLSYDQLTVLVLAAILSLVSKAHLEKKLKEEETKRIYEPFGTLLRWVEAFVYTQVMQMEMIVLHCQYQEISSKIKELF